MWYEPYGDLDHWSNVAQLRAEKPAETPVLEADPRAFWRGHMMEEQGLRS